MVLGELGGAAERVDGGGLPVEHVVAVARRVAVGVGGRRGFAGGCVRWCWWCAGETRSPTAGLDGAVVGFVGGDCSIFFGVGAPDKPGAVQRHTSGSL